MEKYCFVFAVSEKDKTNPPMFIEELKKEGHKVFLLATSQTCSPFNVFIRFKIRMRMDISSFLKRKKEKFGKKVLAVAKENGADAICDVGGFRLTRNTIDLAKDNYATFLVLKDRLVFYNELEELSYHYDTVYTYSDDDAEELNKKGTRTICFHSKGKENEFYKMNCPKKYDVSFVGKMYPEKDYGHRYEILKKLAFDLPNTSIFVGGECAPLRRPKRFLEWVKSKRLRNVFCNRNLSIKQCNEVYNASRICINIEREGTGNTWSGRLTNLLHAGSFVLASTTGILTELFSNYLVTFSSYDDLKEKILYYLNHDEERESIANKGLLYIDSTIDSINKVTINMDMCNMLHEKRASKNE